MSNLKSYQAAEVVENRFSDVLQFFLKVVFVLMQSVFLSVPVFFRWIKDQVLPNPKNVKGQVALITGGSNGIGKAIAKRLALEGCSIAIANRNIAEGEKTAREIQERFGVKVKAFKVDVSKHEEVAKLKQDVEESLGPVDILVNNAGLLALNISLLEGTQEEIQQIIDVNLTAYFWV